MGSFNPACPWGSEGGCTIPAEHGQVPLPPLVLSRDSHPAVTCSDQQPEHGQHGEGCEQPLENPTPCSSQLQCPPPCTFLQGSNKELPGLSPKADGDQPAEGREAAPLVQGNCVLEVVHAKPGPSLATLHARALPQPAVTSQSDNLVAWLMSKEREEGLPQQPVGCACLSSQPTGPVPREGQDRALDTWESPRLMLVGALCLLSLRVSSTTPRKGMLGAVRSVLGLGVGVPGH